jgi:hypothetical protein
LLSEEDAKKRLKEKREEDDDDYDSDLNVIEKDFEILDL